MPTLSPTAAAILDRMEPNRGYEALELRAFVPDASMERLREIMHELWVHRQVERFGYSGWRRQPSTCITEEAAPPASTRSSAVSETKGIKPEDLFDHDAFAGMFR
jgi:hypothetical protein